MAGSHRALRAPSWRARLPGSGSSFGEKLTLLVQLVGLPDLRAGHAVFGSVATMSGGLFALLAFLIAPLVLHLVTTIVSSLGAARDRKAWLVAVVSAVGLHVAYNLTVVSAFG